jgi:phage terminase large subunit-like protein
MTEAEERVKRWCKETTGRGSVACEYVKRAVRRYKRDLAAEKRASFEYRMDWQEVQFFLEMSKEFHLPDREENLDLLDWQLFVFANLLGWERKEDGRRRFRTGAVFVPRKNGKTTGVMYPLLLYDFLTTVSAEAYFFERDEFQAKKMMEDLKQIVRRSPELNRRLKVERGQNITYQGKVISWFSSDTKAVDGYKPTCAILDEYHCYYSDKALTAMRYGTRVRENGLVLIISTAGTDISLPCYEEFQKVKKILDGTIKDETYFGIVFEMDKRGDWRSERAIRQANPSLGRILDMNILKNDLADAEAQASHQADYKAKTLNIWESVQANWITTTQWKRGVEANRGERSLEERFQGEAVYGALDLSSVGDFTAYTLCRIEDGKAYFRHKFYIPEETVREKYRTDNHLIPEWIGRGYITAIPGQTIDYEYIYADIRADAGAYQLKEIAYDNWNAVTLIKDIEEAMPELVLIPYNQALKQMSLPTKNYEKYLKEKRIVDRNPVMEWMAGNAVVQPDVNNNYKPLKQKNNPGARIDGIITAIISLDRAVAGGGGARRLTEAEILEIFR